ncbi:hypothetical protein L596_026080 [Steinernema carpocapsae]|uniref:Serpentine receptor class gamma n=1 Tax=Steinernema carpocapsae TaxID=34508 RepID=A0A4U5M1A2_STECR|nr:hypothetical protein L596_026080 [Steinernema carpocapsae]
MWSRCATGGAALIITVIFTALYSRIICIFLLHRKYRSSECYLIMIQMGIAQCLMAAGAISISLAFILRQDHLNLAVLTAPTIFIAIRTEGILSLALALNRLNAICNLPYPTVVYKILVCIAWSYPIGHYFFYVFPCCAVSIMPDYLMPILRFQNSAVALSNKVAAMVYQSIQVLTLLIYCVLLCYLIYLRRKTKTTPNLVKEGKVLIYALIRFTGDVSYSVVVNYVKFAITPITTYFLFTALIVDILVIPPVLYLVLFRSFRKEVFRMKKSKDTTVKVKKIAFVGN